VVVTPANNPDLPDRLELDSGPYQYTTFRVHHRFEVVGVVDVGEDSCWVINVSAIKLPENVKDDTEGSPLWRLYIRQKNGTLARHEWSLRGGPCLTTGPVSKKGSRDYLNQQPVIPIVPHRCPLDVPLLSMMTSPPEFLLERDKKLEYVDEQSGQARTQRIDILDDIVFGKRTRIVIVTMSGQNDSSFQQKWLTGYPWWVSWSRLNPGETFYGIVRARLVKYGSKDEEGKTVATPEWW